MHYYLLIEDERGVLEITASIDNQSITTREGDDILTTAVPEGMTLYEAFIAALGQLTSSLYGLPPTTLIDLAEVTEEGEEAKLQ